MEIDSSNVLDGPDAEVMDTGRVTYLPMYSVPVSTSSRQSMGGKRRRSDKLKY